MNFGSLVSLGRHTRTPLLLGTLLIASCSVVFPAGAPIHQTPLLQKDDRSGRGRALLVVLPGRLDSPDDLVKQGFVETVEKSGFPLDVVVADAHGGFLKNQTVVDWLQADIFVPAKEQGYSPIFVVGISRGALGAGLYARQHPEMIEGVLLIAPAFDEKVLEFSPERVSGRTRSWERDLWDWIRKVAPESKTKPLLALGFGDEDRHIRTLDILARSFPSERVFRHPGGHDWPPWRASFQAFLDLIQHR